MEKQLRNVVAIDSDRCNACGLCIDVCPDGALALQADMVTLVAESLCGGDGTCIRACPEKALALVRKIAAPYHPAAFKQNASGPQAGMGAARHDAARQSRGQSPSVTESPVSSGYFVESAEIDPVADGGGPCRHWPLKMRLAPVDEIKSAGSHILAAGDCTAFACPEFHRHVQPGKITLIGCPKFENAKELTEKMVEVFRAAKPTACTIARMEKPCCKGMVTICVDAAKAAGMDIPLREAVIHCRGGLGPQQDPS